MLGCLFISPHLPRKVRSLSPPIKSGSQGDYQDQRNMAEVTLSQVPGPGFKALRDWQLPPRASRNYESPSQTRDCLHAATLRSHTQVVQLTIPAAQLSGHLPRRQQRCE